MDHKSTPLASPLENPLSDPNPTPSNGKAQPLFFEISNLPSEIKRSVVGLFRRKSYLCAVFSAILSAVAWRRRKPPATAYDFTERKLRSQSGKPPENPTISNRAKVQRQLKW
jgi:hypothetical protein